jgi:hypothetical protein
MNSRKLCLNIILNFFLATLLMSCSLLDQEPESDRNDSAAEATLETPIPQAAEPTIEVGKAELSPASETAVPAPQEEEAVQETVRIVTSEPPDELVKLVFHHSVGENWLADSDGSLGRALMDNNYFVSDTNYGWGPAGIGDRTDIPDWLEWFRSPESERYLTALYGANDDYSGVFSRALNPDPDRENEIILFKSCYPNSNLEGSPGDPPAESDFYSVSHAKYVYQELLEYFSTRQDKLFVAITAPPVTADDSWTPSGNARAFNNWLVNDWLADYPHNNVAVFDLFNVLSSNGGDSNTNDLGSADGNHHRWLDGSIQHIQSVDNDYAAYPTDDSHPNKAGNRKATAEFVPLLNVYYQLWLGSAPTERPSPPSTAATTEPTAAKTTAGALQESRIQPENLRYLGAFRLPDEEHYEISWAWSGEALASRPGGDPSGPDDGFPGSLFGTGHNLTQFVSEIDIPAPIISPEKELGVLNSAKSLQPFQDIRGDLFDHLDFELPRAGLTFRQSRESDSTGRLHFCWGQHLQGEGLQPSHGWSTQDLSDPRSSGAWSIGDFNVYSTNDYLFSIPDDWSDLYTPGMSLATGRFRDGGWGGQGPSLIAYSPGDPEDPPALGESLRSVPLLLYAGTSDGETLDADLRMDSYHHSDEWGGGAWLETGNQSAVIFTGTKGKGDFWYGFANGLVWPDDPPWPEIPDPPNDDRGWWSTSFEGQIIFYDPHDFAAVALGEMASFEPQPYAVLNIDSFLFDVNSSQQKHHLGAAAFDSENGLLYVLEPLVDEDKPIVHVWGLASGRDY